MPRPSGSAAAISPSVSGSIRQLGPPATTRSSRKAQEDRTGITPFLLVGKRRDFGIRKSAGQLVSANGHVSRFLEELFPDADLLEFQGTLTVIADGGYYCGDRDSDRVQG